MQHLESTIEIVDVGSAIFDMFLLSQYHDYLFIINLDTW